MFFCANGVLTKSLCTERIKFNASLLSASAYLVVNLVVIIVAIPYWCIVEFNQRLFWIGLIGGFINNMGIVLL